MLLYSYSTLTLFYYFYLATTTTTMIGNSKGVPTHTQKQQTKKQKQTNKKREHPNEPHCPDKGWWILNERGLSLPEHLVVGQDNTCREGKNQWFMSVMGLFVLKGNFISSMTVSGQVGHTHNGTDQRFGTMSSIISRNKILQSPEEFMAVVRDHMHGVRNRKLCLRRIHSTWDFQKFMLPMNTGLVGLNPTMNMPWVAHCFRFVRRQDLELYQHNNANQSWAIDNDVSEPHPNDVILLVKQWVHSSALSQNPKMFFQHSKLLDVPNKMEKMVHNRLSKRELEEFRKSAKAYLKKPWNMEIASIYLNEYCRRNEEQEHGGTHNSPPYPHTLVPTPSH